MPQGLNLAVKRSGKWFYATIDDKNRVVRTKNINATINAPQGYIPLWSFFIKAKLEYSARDLMKQWNVQRCFVSIEDLPKFNNKFIKKIEKNRYIKIEQELETEKKIVKKRGRPRKIEIEIEQEVKTEQTIVKKRGRPRKIENLENSEFHKYCLGCKHECKQPNFMLSIYCPKKERFRKGK